MIEVFKIIHIIYDETVSPYLPFNIKANTRGNNYKLQIIPFIMIYVSIISLHVLLTPGTVYLIQ